jgi:transposase-like protein
LKKQTQKSNTRRRFSAAEKSKILKLHLVEGRSISSVCEEFEIQPSQFYSWQALLFEKAENVFDRPRGPKPSDHSAEVKRLESRVREKDEVIAELMAEYLKAKKKTGENS